jgi:Flp pilus assembly protein TadD
MTETFELFQQGREHLAKGRAAQATVALEKAKAREPEKASIREALGIAYFRIKRYPEAETEFRKMLGREAEANGHYKLASSLRPGESAYEARIKDLD